MHVLCDEDLVRNGLMDIHGGITTNDCQGDEMWPQEVRFATGNSMSEIIEYLNDAMEAYSVPLVELKPPDPLLKTKDVVEETPEGGIAFVSHRGGGLIVGKGIGACIVKALISIIGETPFHEISDDDEWDEEEE